MLYYTFRCFSELILIRILFRPSDSSWMRFIIIYYWPELKLTWVEALLIWNKLSIFCNNQKKKKSWKDFGFKNWRNFWNEHFPSPETRQLNQHLLFPQSSKPCDLTCPHLELRIKRKNSWNTTNPGLILCALEWVLKQMNPNVVYRNDSRQNLINLRANEST